MTYIDGHVGVTLPVEMMTGSQASKQLSHRTEGYLRKSSVALGYDLLCENKKKKRGQRLLMTMMSTAFSKRTTVR
ncbi:hypothetical protein Y032_0087g2027 [Ancylostoma ceylanicum]|uniref:Uncharacterized protein n=1 Tax=Ancylostoma ceylanicum TaxID=53326 RepID=A0A016TP34_9BILA|nr:hypothetical protein Y032_0087g2027 [Ancylostoma ceylanicum]